MSITTLNGAILVALDESKYQNVVVQEDKLRNQNSGIVITSNDKHPEIVGKRVYWEEYKEIGNIEQDGKKLAFVRYKHIVGVQE